MKKLLLAAVLAALLPGATSAADLPRRAAPPDLAPLPAPDFSWTGVFIGSHTAYTFSDRQRITTTGNDALSRFALASGIIPATASAEQNRLAQFGGSFGVNYQLTPGSGFVVGAAISADWTDLHKNVAVIGAPVPGIGSLGTVFSQELGFLATINGRLGYAFDRFLVYGTGGVAFGKVAYATSTYLPGGVLLANGTDGADEVGYNYGGGVEYALPRGSFLDKFDLLELAGIHIGGTSTLKVEYIRYDLGSRNVLVTDVAGLGTSATSRFRTEGSMIRAGFAYKFP